MITMTTETAKLGFDRLMAIVRSGESVTILDGNAPVAVVAPSGSGPSEPIPLTEERRRAIRELRGKYHDILPSVDEVIERKRREVEEGLA